MAKTLKNPWTWHPRNQNFRTRFHQQIDAGIWSAQKNKQFNLNKKIGQEMIRM
jgi:hypothetical protein